LTIAEGFNNRSPQLPSEVAGAIDCREMCISVSRCDQQSYINRKLFLSIKLQAIIENLWAHLLAGQVDRMMRDHLPIHLCATIIVIYYPQLFSSSGILHIL
jgi:hypothetical protein